MHLPGANESSTPTPGPTGVSVGNWASLPLKAITTYTQIHISKYIFAHTILQEVMISRYKQMQGWF